MPGASLRTCYNKNVLNIELNEESKQAELAELESVFPDFFF